MKINIIAVGKLKHSDAEQILIENYINRINWPVEFIIFESKNKDTKQAQSQESLFFAKYLPNAYNILLDEKGKNLTSLEFSRNIEKAIEYNSNVNILIGGADGFSPEIKNKANLSLSFGNLTWPHKLVRVMLAEQLYRAYSIVKNHPYHREG